jgi:hypothetical protein
MSVRVEGQLIRLEGACGVEEAETLAALLDETQGWEIDLSGCGPLHASLVQALLAFRPKMLGTPPEDVFIRDFLLPALALALEDR